MQSANKVQGMPTLLRNVICGVLGICVYANAPGLTAAGAKPRPQLGPPATHAVPQRIRVSAGVMAANLLTKVDPVYPEDAKRAKVQGSVVLDAVISKDGLVETLLVISGPNELRESALDAVRQWTYKPFRLNGEPVEVETTVTVTYSLQN